MPQMMPMYWLIMSIMSMIMLMVITSFIYFLLMPTMPTSSKLLSYKMITWSWKW